MEARESWMPRFLCQSLLLSTTVLNDTQLRVYVHIASCLVSVCSSTVHVDININVCT